MEAQLSLNDKFKITNRYIRREKNEYTHIEKNIEKTDRGVGVTYTSRNRDGRISVQKYRPTPTVGPES